MTVSTLSLSAGLAFSDRIEALLDGRVDVDGATLAISCRQPQALFRSVLRDQTFDVCEFSLGSHIAAVAAGNGAYVGLPIFVSRAFRHGNVYVRTDRGIASPQDLAGRRIGVIDFHQTAALWVRGILADGYGVERSSIEWITGGLSTPVLEDRATLDLPPSISVRRSTQTLNDLLEEGAIDGVISPTAPALFTRGDPRVARLWPDHRAAERAWFGDTGIFPIMHLLVLRRRCVETAPRLAKALFEAFDRARQLASSDLTDRDYPKIASPWLMADRTRTLAELGGDPWSYGVPANRAALEAILRYAEADGLTKHRLAPEALFADLPGADDLPPSSGLQ
ncbi:ABC transporter substrate-binding protein [Sphingomonas sp. BAUL-RG-20F-R05-02]|uniref:ABC transporter substrate-binding protein n=1 Tax=Sphingomonas sp. BAUL-RG-20F-R05-02 TaxID=2914830 RepID=UPI001F5A2CE9|nr:ABC transporter substrate-binding protein [Sphingomonas sp. BAUL-RG-20F-R05-02]